MTLGLGYWPMKADHGPGVCKLPECSAAFRKRAPNQEYCDPVHQIRDANQKASVKNKAATVKRRTAV